MKLKKQRKMMRDIAREASEFAIRPLFSRMCKCPLPDRICFAFHLLTGNDDLDRANSRSSRLRELLFWKN